MTVLTAHVPLSTLDLDIRAFRDAELDIFEWTEVSTVNYFADRIFTILGNHFRFDEATEAYAGDVTSFSIDTRFDRLLHLSNFSMPLQEFITRLNEGDGAGLIAALTTGNDVFYGSEGDDTLTSHAGHDLIYGHGGADRMSGGQGDDVIDGGDGNDLVLGRSAADRLVGGAGDDAVRGGRGDDVIFGGAGKDRLFGGAGADIFVFTDVTDSQAGRDVIVDFNGADGDRIDLSALGSLRFGGNRFDGIAGEVVVRASAGGDWVVMADMDGDRSADLRILVSSPVELGASDFILSVS